MLTFGSPNGQCTHLGCDLILLDKTSQLLDCMSHYLLRKHVVGIVMFELLEMLGVSSNTYINMLFKPNSNDTATSIHKVRSLSVPSSFKC